jgi:hypothetical protein
MQLRGRPGLRRGAAVSYRVWCPSLDDTEDDACEISTLDAGAHWDATERNRARITLPSYRSLDAKDAAEVYADYCHAHRDGWDATWPLDFRVKCEDGSIVDFEVDREAVPEFTARKKRPTPDPDAEGLPLRK